VSRRDASWHEMSGFTTPGRPGREPDEQLLDTILAGQPLRPDAPRGLHVVVEQLADLASPAGPGQPPGEAAAVAAYCRAVSSGLLAPRQEAGHQTITRAGCRRWPPAAGRARIAAALTVACLALGATAAAYAGALPGQVQAIAHKIIDAPPARHRIARQAQPGRPRGPEQRSQPAAHRYGHSAPHGKARGHAQHPPPGKSESPGHNGHHRHPR